MPAVFTVFCGGASATGVAGPGWLPGPAGPGAAGCGWASAAALASGSGGCSAGFGFFFGFSGSGCLGSGGVSGTTGGVGFYRDPQVFMKEGDTIEVELDKIGVLKNPIVNEK